MPSIANLFACLLGLTLVTLFQVSAAPRPLLTISAAPSVEGESLPAVQWPELGSRAPKLPVNQERMARGLGPLPPAKLYERTPTHQFAPRISPVPAGSGIFAFVDCSGGGSAQGVADITGANSAQDAVNRCAVETTNRGYDSMFVGYFNQWICVYGITQTSAQACTADNYGYYVSSGIP